MKCAVTCRCTGLGILHQVHEVRGHLQKYWVECFAPNA
jgi:hypothetical protein